MIRSGVLTDRTQYLRMALENPGLLILQDLLKLFAATSASLLVLAFHFRLESENTRRMRIATAAGLLGVIFLLANTGLSMSGVLYAREIRGTVGAQINPPITVLAIVVLVSGGIWYLLSNLVALRAAVLPKRLCRRGIAVGVTSLLPPIALVALVLSIVWSLLVARYLKSQRL